MLLIYPLEWPMSNQVAANTLDYYAERSDPDGPAMTDAMHAVDSAQIGEPGCATNTYLNRSIKPFVRDPFAQFVEARGDKAGAQDPLAGSPALNFTTGSGGFAQVFLYGLTGFRWRADHVQLDPMLPPQLSGGVTLTGLRWRGRSFDVRIGATTTTVTLRSGSAMPVRVARHRPTRSAAAARSACPTRRPDLTPTSNLARCRPATATSEEPGHVRRGRRRRQRGDRAGRRTPAATGSTDRRPRPAREGEDHRGPLDRHAARVVEHRDLARREHLDAGAHRTPRASCGTRSTARYVRVTLTRPGEELTGVRELVVTG